MRFLTPTIALALVSIPGTFAATNEELQNLLLQMIGQLNRIEGKVDTLAGGGPVPGGTPSPQPSEEQSAIQFWVGEFDACSTKEISECTKESLSGRRRCVVRGRRNRRKCRPNYPRNALREVNKECSAFNDRSTCESQRICDWERNRCVVDSDGEVSDEEVDSDDEWN